MEAKSLNRGIPTVVNSYQKASLWVSKCNAELAGHPGTDNILEIVQ